MRIVGGKWKGLAIEAPEGKGTTRPTTDRNRERFASMILSARGLDLEGVSVLDAYAGSGAMGFELVSRGASRATFIDLDRRAVARIGRTARNSLHAAPGEWRAVSGDALALAEQGRVPGGPFGVVFLDPPYAVEAQKVAALVEALAASGQLEPAAVVVYERSSKAPGISGDGLSLVKSKTQGATAVDLMVWGGPGSEGAEVAEVAEVAEEAEDAVDTRREDAGAE